MVTKRSPSSEKRKEDENGDVYDGPLKKRRFGLRIDDEVEIQVIAGNTLITLEGRILSMKDDMEIIDQEGFYHRVFMDWIVDIKLKNHNRPRPEKDPELARKVVKQKPKKSPVDHAYN